MNVILLAAGKGKRLNPETSNLPKPLVKINKNKTIFDFFLSAFEEINVTKKLYITTGFKKECFKDSNSIKIFNPQYESTNMLFGLWYTLSKIVNFSDDTIISYGDIIFPKTLLKEISQMDELTIITDPNWETNYVGRSSHGFEECEKCIVNANKNLMIASKDLPKQFSKYSEYIGVFFIPKKFMPTIMEILNKLFLRKNNLDEPFIFSKTLRKAYLTDFFTYLIMNNFNIKSREIFGSWQEIDTLQDLKKARGILYE